MRRTSLKVIVLLAAYALSSIVDAATPEDDVLVGSNSGPPTTNSYVSIKPGPPPGFEALVEPQQTEADIYFGGEFVASAFIEYDLHNVTIEDPLSVVELIPTLKNPATIAKHLSGPQPTNSHLVCNARNRDACGFLEPEMAGIIFDEARFTVTLFVHHDQQIVHHAVADKYLPKPTTGVSSLNNIRLTASGALGLHRYSISSESFVARNNGRVRARYAIADGEASLYNMSWQYDEKDYEYEVGSFRSKLSAVGLVRDAELMGARWGTSTRLRQDLDNATATPLFLFLHDRSRVELFRNEELLDARFYNAGNQQVDTTQLPEGAYDLEIVVTHADGRVERQSQFFVRNGNMPPLNEPQYFLESGSISEVGSHTPQSTGAGWMRAGSNIRVKEDLALSAEVIWADDTLATQSGISFVRPRWYMQLGGLLSNERDRGFSLNTNYRQEKLNVSLDYRRVVAAEVARRFEYSVVPNSHTQASATIAFPMQRGNFFIRGVYSAQGGQSTTGIGLSYLGSLFHKAGVSADITFDANATGEDTWVRAGITLRWRNFGSHATVRPQYQYAREDGVTSQDPFLDARWSTSREYERLGAIDHTLFGTHDPQHSALGARFVSRRYQDSDLELGYAKRQDRSGLFYASNSRLSIASASGKTTIGTNDGGAGALIIHIDGNTFGEFEVLVDDRVVGSSWAQRPNTISLRAYETYDVRIRPLGDRIVGYDQSPQTVTLYPGNVQTLRYTAHDLFVVISQAVNPSGHPLEYWRFINVEGLGVTDEQGWFQIEVGHNQPLFLFKTTPAGPIYCRLDLGEVEAAQDGLVVVDQTVCTPIPVQQLRQDHPDILRRQLG